MRVAQYEYCDDWSSVHIHTQVHNDEASTSRPAHKVRVPSCVGFCDTSGGLGSWVLDPFGVSGAGFGVGALSSTPAKPLGLRNHDLGLQYFQDFRGPRFAAKPPATFHPLRSRETQNFWLRVSRD